MLGTLVLLAGVASAQFGYSQDELDLFDLVEEVGVQETLYVIYQYTVYVITVYVIYQYTVYYILYIIYFSWAAKFCNFRTRQSYKIRAPRK